MTEQMLPDLFFVLHRLKTRPQEIVSVLVLNEMPMFILQRIFWLFVKHAWVFGLESVYCCISELS